MDERRGLQRLPGAFPTEIAGREAPQFVVHERHERRQRLLVALTRALNAKPQFALIGPFPDWLAIAYQ